MAKLKQETDKQVKKRNTENAIYEDYQLFNTEGQSKTELVKYIAKKHHIAYSTVYAVLKRVNKRMNQQ